MPQLVDTGILFALADRSDAWHARARAHVQSSPDILLAPATILTEVAYLLRHRLGPEAELAVARAAASLGLTMVLSTLSSKTLEQVAKVLGPCPHWFQLYWPKDREFTASLEPTAE